MAGKKNPEVSEEALQVLPESGGSYTRDPATGELTPQACTKSTAEEAIDDKIEFPE